MGYINDLDKMSADMAHGVEKFFHQDGQNTQNNQNGAGTANKPPCPCAGKNNTQNIPSKPPCPCAGKQTTLSMTGPTSQPPQYPSQSQNTMQSVVNIGGQPPAKQISWMDTFEKWLPRVIHKFIGSEPVKGSGGVVNPSTAMTTAAPAQYANQSGPSIHISEECNKLMIAYNGWIAIWNAAFPASGALGVMPAGMTVASIRANIVALVNQLSSQCGVQVAMPGPPVSKRPITATNTTGSYVNRPSGDGYVGIAGEEWR